MDPLSVAELLRNEHPQIVAAILVHLDSEQAAGILQQLSDRQRSEVLLRVATLEGIQPTALKDLNEVLFKVLAGGRQDPQELFGRCQGCRRNHQFAGRQHGCCGARVHPWLRPRPGPEDHGQDVCLRGHPQAGRQIHPDRAQGSRFRNPYCCAQGRSTGVARKIPSNMSSRAAEALREDLESRGPMRLSEVEAQQKEILKTVRRLSDEGQIVIAGGGDDAFV